MWYDADIDALMTRTAKRPIPVGRVMPGEALGFGMTLSGFAVMTMALLVNWLSAGLLAFTIVFYAAIYTAWLKRLTPQNIVIGGAAGALPPMIGWAAVTNSIGLESILLFLIIFFWTPPHFWALSLSRAADYARAGVPMLPVVAGAQETKKQIVIYSVLMLPVGMLPWFCGYTSALYGAVAFLGGAAMAAFAVRLIRAGNEPDAEQAAKHLFAYSVLYLTVLFAVILVDHSLAWPFGRIVW
jgi:protoheme IX farnesyltransferase